MSAYNAGEQVEAGEIRTDSGNAYLSLQRSIGASLTDTDYWEKIGVQTEAEDVGFQLPIFTIAERDAIASPTAGLEIYNSDDDEVQYYDGATWVGPAGVGGGITSIGGSTPTSLTGILKGNGSDVDVATAGTDYVAPNGAITGATKTKITYDAKGLVTAGADATTADIADSSNKRYVTDAQQTVLGNTSGTNTGDQTSIVGITGTKSQFDTACTDGNFLYSGDVTQYTDEMAQDAIGAMIADTSTIDITYTDATPELKADVKDGSITLAKQADVATSTVFYRKTAGTGSPEVQTLATLKTDLGLSGTNTGDQTSVSGNAGTATALATARNIDGQAFDGTANITVIAPGTHAATSKATPVDADEVPLVDSAASNVLKKLTWANLKATIKAYTDTLYPSGSGTSTGTNTGDQNLSGYQLTSAKNAASGYAGLDSSSKLAGSQVKVRMTFWWQVLAVGAATTKAGQLQFATNTTAFSINAVLTTIKMHTSGSIVGGGIISSAAITAQTITLKANIAGSTNATNIAQLSTTNPRSFTGTVAPGTITFSANDAVGADFVTVASFAPTTANYVAWLEVEFDT